MCSNRIAAIATGPGLALAMLIAAGPVSAQCSADEVVIRGDWGQARFSVELADDPRERARGLMNRDSMPASHGMLFIYERPQRASFWMKNTLIPLDMLFIDRDGRISRLHENAVPLDETSINGGKNVFAVLEINGGLAERIGIEAGSVLRHPAFGPNAAWPCAAP